jgi:cobalt-zinc-cadmium efflux system outer membrane protein
LGGVEGGFLAATALPAGAAPLARNPEFAALAAARTVAAAQVRHEEAKAWPDVTVSLGAENEDMEGRGPDWMGMVGVQVPLPLFDRNQGAIAAAEAEARRAAEELKAAEARLAAEYEGLRGSAAALETSRRMLATEAIPAREREQSLAEAAARGGRTDLAPALMARLGVIELREKLLETEIAVAEKVARGLAILGRPPAEWAGAGSVRR